MGADLTLNYLLLLDLQVPRTFINAASELSSRFLFLLSECRSYFQLFVNCYAMDFEILTAVEFVDLAPCRISMALAILDEISANCAKKIKFLHQSPRTKAIDP